MAAPATTAPLWLGRELGRGAHSTVYEVASVSEKLLAPPADGSARVAKVTKCATDDEGLKVFAKAADIRDIPRHPGVATYELVHLGVPGRHDVAAVMRRYAGDLSQLVARRRGRPEADGIAVATVLCVGEQLSAALTHLHAHKVWHLDVSFGNVLVSDVNAAEPHCVIVDLENSRVSATDTPSPDFTADFAAPERSNIAECGAKCDVFSLAVLLYALATAAEFPGLVDGIPGLGAGFLSRPEMTPARVAAVIHRDLPSSPQLASLLVTALSHDPATRIPMSHFCRALQRLRGGGTLAFPEVLAPLRVRLTTDEAARNSVIINESAAIFDINDPCCVCGNVRHVNLKLRTDCRDQALHLPGNTCPGSRRGPGALLGTDTSELAAGLAFHFLYPLVPEAAASASASAAAAAAVAAPAGGSAPSTPAAAPTPEESGDGFVAVVNPRPWVNALQLHGGFCISAPPPPGERYSHPRGLMVIDDRTDAAAADGPPSARLAFTAPQPWPSECTAQLQRDGRFHSPIPALLGTTDDARAFAWVMPGEAFTLRNGESWEPAPEGGFVFLFGDGDPTRVSGHLDRFFGVATAVAANIEGRPAAGRVASSAANFAKGLGGFLKNVCAGVDRAVRPPQPQPAAPDAAAAAAATASPPPPPPQPAPAEEDAATAADPTPPSAAAAPTAPPLQIALHAVGVRLSDVRVDQHVARWSCERTGEAGELGACVPVAPAVAAALRMPPGTTTVRFMVRSERGPAEEGSADLSATSSSSAVFRNAFTHNGLAGFAGGGADGPSRLAAILSLRVVVGSGGSAGGRVLGMGSAGSAAVADALGTPFKLPMLIPAEGHTTAEYRGADAPAWLGNAVPPQASPPPPTAATTSVAMMALAPTPEAGSIDWFFAAGDMSTWHVRRIRPLHAPLSSS